MEKKKNDLLFIHYLICALILSGVMISGIWFLTVRVSAAQRGFEELTYGVGQKIYVLLPGSYDPDQRYPSVYFMPQDGFSAQQYLYDGIEGRIRDLEEERVIPAMIYVFPEFRSGVDPADQISEAIDAVQAKYPAIDDASMRGAIGTAAGGYLAFWLGYGIRDQEVEEEPVHFSAIASHDGDFTSERNPFSEQYGDLYSILHEKIGTYGADQKWLANYYTYLDCNSDSTLAWEEGGTADIAYLYRSDSLTDSESPVAWDYSVFDYSIRNSSNYGTYLDNLERSIGGFACAFHMEDDLPEAETETELPIQETIVSGNGRMIDLMGDWYFRTTEAMKEDDPKADADSIDSVLQANWESWDVVQPGLDWWTGDFASCLRGNPYYMGYAWYVREFEVPDGFDVTGLQIVAGMVDEADEVYLNGVRVGQTGIPEEGGSYDGSNPWDEERVYPIPDDLLQTGKNLVAVRICNGSGGGGWYAGPIQIECQKEETEDPAGQKLRYYTTSFEADSLNGQEIEYRVYLPEGYYESDLHYPVVYMLHGYGSTGKSFEIAGVPKILDEGIASGEIPPCIVIFPTDGHPQKSGWWSGAYANMLNEDLVAQVDKTLRTVDSREYRFLAGESMGGGGAYLNALNHPELYGGVFDIYGALRYTDALRMFLEMDAEDLGQFRHYIICGNHDMYGFDLDHILMGRHLTQLRVPHVFEIDDGEHASSFYLPRIKDGFQYLLSGIQPADGGNGLPESTGMDTMSKAETEA